MGNRTEKVDVKEDQVCDAACSLRTNCRNCTQVFQYHHFNNHIGIIRYCNYLTGSLLVVLKSESLCWQERLHSFLSIWSLHWMDYTWEQMPGFGLPPSWRRGFIRTTKCTSRSKCLYENDYVQITSQLFRMPGWIRTCVWLKCGITFNIIFFSDICRRIPLAVGVMMVQTEEQELACQVVSVVLWQMYWTFVQNCSVPVNSGSSPVVHRANVMVIVRALRELRNAISLAYTLPKVITRGLFVLLIMILLKTSFNQFHQVPIVKPVLQATLEIQWMEEHVHLANVWQIFDILYFWKHL